MEESAHDQALQDSATALLVRIEAGDAAAQAELFELLYPELRLRAGLQMRGQPVTHTLQATALVNEVFVRLVKPRAEGFRDRAHFLRAAAKAMRHTLIDHSRRSSAQKRTANRVEMELDEFPMNDDEPDLPIEELEAALAQLEAVDPKMAEAVELRFYGGASVSETASALGLAQRTFEARWRATREWLLAKLSP